MEQADAEPPPGRTDPADDAAALEALLRWYVAMGVDAPIGESPRDGFALSASSAARESAGRDAAPPASAATRGPAAGGALPATAPGMPLSAEALLRQAEAIAASAATLAELAERWATLPGCDLAAKSTGMIFSGGTAGSPLMLVGGAPDSDDERLKQAFAGSKGRLLDAMLRAIGLAREQCYLAHVVPWRPPGNRPPTPLELSLCLPFARRQIALARPRLLLCLGERAAQPLLGSRDPVSRLRGRILSFEGEASTVRALVTYPPDYLLKQPLGKRRAWTDLQMAAAALTTPGDGGAAQGRLEPSGTG